MAAFTLNPLIKTDDGNVALDQDFDENPLEADGYLIPEVDGAPLIEADESQADPLVRLASSWLMKMPWIIGGDEECVPLRHSPYCYGFEPGSNNDVQLYFYEGTEGDVETLLMEPISIPLSKLVQASLTMGRDILHWALEHLDDQEEEDIEELKQVIDETKAAWADYKD